MVLYEYLKQYKINRAKTDCASFPPHNFAGAKSWSWIISERMSVMNETDCQLGIVDLNTGTLIREFDNDIIIKTKKQQDFYQMKLRQIEAQKDYGPFTWMLYNSEEGIFNNLTQSTITRLIYVSTFLGYDGYLVHDNYKTLKKDQLKEKVGVSDREFNSFWKEIAIDNKIIYEDNKRYFYERRIA